MPPGFARPNKINTKLKRQVESARLQAHSEVVSNWGILQSSAGEIASARAAVVANKTTLEGSRKEQEIGQRTTLDVLNTQRDLVDSEIGLAVALRNRIVAILSSTTMKNKWAGLRPPPPPSADE